MYKLNNNIRLKLQIGSQFLKTQMIMWTSTGLGESFKRQYKNFSQIKPGLLL
jgi:hypothetical protein